MAKIKLTIEDDNGDLLAPPQDFPLAVGDGTLAEIEAAVEQFKHAALPEIEKQLLQRSQAQLLEKKEDW